MKLIVFNQQTLPKSSTKREQLPHILFRSSGTIYLNESAVNKLSLKAGDCISIAQDESNPSDWYLYADNAGWPLRVVNKQKGLSIQHSNLVRTFIGAFELDNTKSHKFLIAGEPTLVKGSKNQYWGLLHSSN